MKQTAALSPPLPQESSGRLTWDVECFGVGYETRFSSLTVPLVPWSLTDPFRKPVRCPVGGATRRSDQSVGDSGPGLVMDSSVSEGDGCLTEFGRNAEQKQAWLSEAGGSTPLGPAPQPPAVEPPVYHPKEDTHDR